MDNSVVDTDPKGDKESSSPYPVESILTAIANVEKVFAERGTIQPVSKDDISLVLGKKPATLVLTYSTWSQYGIVNNIRSKGYLPTPLFKKYQEKTYNHHEREAMLQMFKSVPLYSKLISNLDGQQLPAEDKFQNILKDQPYGINPNSAERAARVFYENLRDLSLIDRFNKFRFNESQQETPIKNQETSPAKNNHNSNGSNHQAEHENLDFPIYMTAGKKATFSCPMNVTTADIQILKLELETRLKTLAALNADKLKDIDNSKLSLNATVNEQDSIMITNKA